MSDLENIHFHSQSVADFCERFNADPDLAASICTAGGMRTAWWMIDRPAWLLWAYCMAVLDEPLSAGLQNTTLLAHPSIAGGLVARMFPDDGIIGREWSSFEEVDGAACEFFRKRVPCPFAPESALPDCVAVAPEPEPAQPAAPAQPGPPRVGSVNLKTDPATGTVNGIDVDGRAFVPLDEAAATIDRQRAVIHHGRTVAHHWRRAAIWTACAVTVLPVLVLAMVWLIRHEDEGAGQ